MDLMPQHKSREKRRKEKEKTVFSLLFNVVFKTCLERGGGAIMMNIKQQTLILPWPRAFHMQKCRCVFPFLSFFPLFILNLVLF